MSYSVIVIIHIKGERAVAFEKIDIPSPRDIFVREIEGRIIKGKLTAGEKLPTERELALQTGIPQSTIHIALRDLEHMGFLRIVPRQGVYVADIAKDGTFETLSEILRYTGGKIGYKMSVELVELRNSIEGGALIRLAKSHTDEDIAKLNESLDRLRGAVGLGLSVQELGQLTSEFHHLVCELSGNEIFSLVLNAFGPMSTTLWENCAAFWGAEGFVQQDQKLIEYIERGEGYEAQKYIEDIFGQFLAAFNADPHVIDRK